MPFFVNVPNVAGVPPVAFAGTAIADLATTLLTTDLVGALDGFFGPQWGIFLDGTAIVTADTVASVQYKQEWVVSDYPVEEGAFETYDKVSLPFEARVRFASGENEANRQSLLDSISAIAGDLNLYDVVTPTATYSSANVAHYDYTRTSSNGLGLLVVDVWLVEVRVTTGSSLDSTQQPDGSDPTNGGTVQPTAPTGNQSSDLSNIG